MGGWFEKRKHKRVPVDGEAKITLNGDKESEPIIGMVHDLSSGGVRFSAPQGFGTGTLLDIEILFGSSNIKASGKVVWEDQSGEVIFVAIQFSNYSVNAREVISSIVTGIGL